MPRLWPVLAVLLTAGCDSAAPPTVAPSLVGEWTLAGVTNRLLVTAPNGGDYVDFRAPVRGAITADGAALHVVWVSAEGLSLSGDLAGRPVRLFLGTRTATLHLGLGADEETVWLTPDAPPYAVTGATLTVPALAFQTRSGPVAVGGAATFPTLPLAPGVETEVPPLQASGADCDEAHTFSLDGAYAHATTCEGYRSAWTGRWALDGPHLKTAITVEDRYGRGGISEIEREFEVAIGARTLDLTTWSLPCEGACAASRDVEAGLPEGTLGGWREASVGHFVRTRRR